MGVVRALVVGIGRFAAGIGEVPVGAVAWSDLPFVDEVVPPVTAALNRLGYTTEVHRDVGAAALRTAVDEALGAARVVYVASHGDADAANPYRVDVVPADACVGRGTNVAQWVDDAQRLGSPTLFLFDLCRSGRAASLPHMVHGSDTPAYAWVMTASGAGQDAYDGRFSVALAEVFEEVARTGLDTDPARSHVPFSKVARRVAQRVERMPGMVQSVQSTAMVLAEDEPNLPFFPNPVHDPDAARLAGVEPALRVFLDPSDVRHFTDKAGVRFTGRRSQLRVLAPWLDDVAVGGLRVVTGNPGVGKSALLGALACASHPELVAVAGHVRERLDARDASGCPSINDLLAAVHARGRTSAEVFASAARQLGMDPGPDVLMDATVFIALLPATGEVPVVIVDALDEASEPVALCANLVRLVGVARADGTPAVRLLVGTRRRPMFTPLLDRAIDVGGLLDLDDAHPDEVREDLADHLGARLADISAFGPPRMRAIRHHLARAIADRLAPNPDRRAEWGAFLVAGIFTRHLTQVPAPADPDTAGRLGSSAPTTLPAVLDLDLASRPDGPGVRAILSALALARGAGMPLEVALPLAGLFADVDPDRARTLVSEALFYLRATPDHDDTLLYRLFHQGLVDHLVRQSTTDPLAPTPDDVLEHFLATHTTHDGHVRSWDTAPPYLLRHAPAHAEAAGRLEELLTDTEYLVHGDPIALVRAFPRAGGTDALSARAVYRASIGVHRQADPGTRRRLLATDAIRYRAAAPASTLDDRIETGVWTTVAATGGILNPALRDTMTGHTDLVVAVACSVVGGRPVAVTGSNDRTVRVWDLTTGTPLGEPVIGHTGAVVAIACTVLGGRPVAVTGSKDATMRVWDLTTGAPVGEPLLAGHTGGVVAIACTVVAGRPVVVTGSNDTTVRVWDPTTGTPLGEPLTGHISTVVAIACTAINARPVAVTGSHDATVRVWDLTTGTALGEPLTGHTDWVRAVACTLVDGRPVAVTGSDDRTVRIWDLTTGTSLGEPLTGHTGAVRTVACTVIDGRPVAVTGSDDDTVRIWDLTTRTPLGEALTGHTGAVIAVGCTKLEGRPVAVTGSDDRTVRIWDLTTHTPLGEPLTGHTDWVDAAACTVVGGRPVGATGSRDATVRLWDLGTGTPLGEPFIGHTDWVVAVACAVVGGRPVAVTGSWDAIVRVWDLNTGTQLGVPLTGHTGGVVAVACAVVGGRPVAVTGSDDDTVRMWDLTAHAQLGEPLIGHADWVRAVACTTIAGRPVAVTGSHDATVRVWDLTTQTQLGQPLKGHTDWVRAVACTTIDGRPVAATGSNDRTARVWDLADGRCLDRIPLPSACVALDWGPDGRLFAGFGRDIAVLHRKPHHPGERPVHGTGTDFFPRESS
ncbi:AAA family ATPase [Embleya sp. NPDC127516]|uniref:AAA family ATPase n=1 Tax=Embleya sp. NPDC127516 TaxID=3363990 RepID=UPI00381BE602